MRRLILLGAVALVGSACSAESDPAPDSSLSVSETAAPTTTISTSLVTSTEVLAATSTSLALVSESIEQGPLAPRGGHSVLWTGQEVIVWGGEADENGNVIFDDGAAYEPIAGDWRSLSAAPISGRRNHIAVWTGEEMLIVGGVGQRDGGAYRPDSDSWRTISDPPISVGAEFGVGIEGLIGYVWTGEDLVVWHVSLNEAAAYDPSEDAWKVLPSPDLEADNGVLRWDGESVYAFGATVGDYPQTNELSVVRLVDGDWETLPETEFSTETYTIGALPKLTAWAGNKFLAWSDSGREGRTMALTPDTTGWSQDDAVPSSACDFHGEPISADGLVIAFGWCDPHIAIYRVDTASWLEAPVGGTPTARYTVWTGDRLINWGDTCCYGTGGQPFTVKAWEYKPPS